MGPTYRPPTGDQLQLLLDPLHHPRIPRNRFEQQEACRDYSAGQSTRRIRSSEWDVLPAASFFMAACIVRIGLVVRAIGATSLFRTPTQT